MAVPWRRLTSGAAAILAVVALLAAVRQLPSSLRSAQAQVSTNAGLSRIEREEAPARAYGMHMGLALEAARLLPRNAVFYVATGGQPGSDGAPSFYAYWLLPRRHTEDIHAADWILSWGADPSALGVETAVVADLGGGAEVLRVER